MKKLFFCFALFFSFSLAQINVNAEPIKDNLITTKRVSWYSNEINGRMMNCAETCKMHNATAAEHEYFYYNPASGDNRMEITFVCKVLTKVIRPDTTVVTHVPAPITWWVYGNQYSAIPVCEYIKDRSVIAKSEKFFCLCANQ